MKPPILLASSLLALASGVAPSLASATTVAFTYSGADPDDGYVTAAGSGTLSFNGTGALTLASLTGFSFAQTTTLADPSLTGSGSFTYGLADVLSFSGIFGNGSFSALSLKTRTTSDPTGFLADQSFQIRSLRTGGAGTAFDDAGRDEATQGTARIAAAVPEPAIWATMVLGLGLIGSTMRRYRRTPARVAFAV